MEHLYQLWLIFSLLGVAIFTSQLLKKYSGKSHVSKTVKTLTFTGWFLGLATIALLPLDISLAQQTKTADTESMEY